MIKVLSLCDGMACGLMALKELRVDVEYHAVELNKSSRILADTNYPEIKRKYHDVRDIKEVGFYDLVMFGSPCKSVSPASNSNGLEGSSGLLLDCLNVLNKCKVKNPKVKYLIENVKMKGSYYQEYCGLIGHQAVLIDSSLVSAQQRLRYYWTNFSIKEIANRKISLTSVLKTQGHAWSKSGRYKDKNGKVFSSPAIGREYFIEERFKKIDKANTLMATKYCRGQSTATVKASGEYLTVRECAKLQTIPDYYNFGRVSENVAYRCIGDGWTVEVIKEILGNIL